MRLFAGLSLSEDVTELLDSLIARLRPAARISWSPRENLHITTKFLGEFPDSRLPELTAELRKLGRRAAFPVTVSRLGFFPNPHLPRIFWSGVQAGDPLAKLASETDRTTANLGVAEEKRTYSPHVTLARIREHQNLADLRVAIAQIEDQNFGTFAASGFHLYESRTGSGGSVYLRLATFPFEEAA